MADMMPIIVLGGLAIGAFVLIQNPSIIQNLFPQAPPPAAAAPVSGASTATPVTPAATAGCMGTDILTGQPCPCPSSTDPSVGLQSGNKKRMRRVRGPQGQILIIPESVGPSFIHGATSVPTVGGSTTCDCSKCGQTSSSILGGTMPSQFDTGSGDLNNFVGGAIAQAAYGLR